MMNYCQRCGSPMPGQFCGNCGAPVGVAIPPQPASPKKRRWPWIVGFVVLLWAGGTYYFYQDNERKLAEARNQGTELLSTDPKTGVITARDKKTGKIITMDMNDIEPDQVTLPDLASTLPPYPNAVRSPSAKPDSLVFSTSDPVMRVAPYYDRVLHEAGLSVARPTTLHATPGSIFTLTGTDASRKRRLRVILRSEVHGTTIEITE